MCNGRAQYLLIFHHPPHLLVVLSQFLFHVVKLPAEYAQFVLTLISDLKIQVIVRNLLCSQIQLQKGPSNLIPVKQKGGHNNPRRT